MTAEKLSILREMSAREELTKRGFEFAKGGAGVELIVFYYGIQDEYFTSGPYVASPRKIEALKLRGLASILEMFWSHPNKGCDKQKQLTGTIGRLQSVESQQIASLKQWDFALVDSVSAEREQVVFRLRSQE